MPNGHLYMARFGIVVANKFGGKIYIDQMTTDELRDRINECDIVFLPCGAVENHGPQAPIGEDIYIGTYIAERVAYETGISVAPPIFYGSHPSHHHGMFGTIPVKKDFYIGYVTSVVKWLSHTGFKKIIIFNSHGQEYVLPIVKDNAIIEENVHALIFVTSWWAFVRDILRVGTELKPGLVIETPFIHADEVETSVTWYVVPHLVKPEKFEEAKAERMMAVLPEKWADKAGNVYGRPFGWYDISQYMEIEYYPKGSVGDPTKSNREKGEVIVETAVKRIIEFVEWLKETYPVHKVPRVWPPEGAFKF
jgi:creatinine amidohydrolase/Fe(II)-dependent formamide hydrolase-like protein